MAGLGLGLGFGLGVSRSLPIACITDRLVQHSHLAAAAVPRLALSVLKSKSPVLVGVLVFALSVTVRAIVSEFNLTIPPLPTWAYSYCGGSGASSSESSMGSLSSSISTLSSTLHDDLDDIGIDGDDHQIDNEDQFEEEGIVDNIGENEEDEDVDEFIIFLLMHDAHIATIAYL